MYIEVSMDPVTCMPDSDQKPSAPASGSQPLAASDKGSPPGCKRRDGRGAPESRLSPERARGR